MHVTLSRAISVAALTAAGLSLALPAEAGHHKVTTTTKPAPVPTATAPAAAATAPVGQSTAVATSYGFDAGLSGWAPLLAPTSWVAGVGHTSVGALSVVASGLNTAAASP